MKKMMTLVGFVFMVLVVVGCADNDSNSGAGDTEMPILRMGTSADYYPFQFIEIVDGEEVIVGFDVDIAQYIADALGMELVIYDMDFNTLITALRSDRVDMVLASMSPTEERAEVVDFSNVYYQSNPGLVLASSPLTSLEELNGLTIGVQTGTLQEDIANGLIEDGMDIDPMVMDRIPDLVQQLLVGRVDAIIVNLLTAEGHAEAHDGLYVVDIIPPVALGAAIAFPQGSDLVEQVNEVLAEMEADGTMAALVEQWLAGTDY